MTRSPIMVHNQWAQFSDLAMYFRLREKPGFLLLCVCLFLAFVSVILIIVLKVANQ